MHYIKHVMQIIMFCSNPPLVKTCCWGFCGRVFVAVGVPDWLDASQI